jgi:SAM-dependent methyltransferase
LIICPDCSQELASLFVTRCGVCGWQTKAVDGIPAFFRSFDLSSPIARSYKKNYDDLAQEDLTQSIVDEQFINNLARNLVGGLGTVSGLDVCDVGSGKGFAVRLLVERGARSVTAVDITPNYLRTLTGIDGVQPVLANAETLPFQHQFDAIISTDVMEHVLNLGSFLYSVNRALKAGGRFVVRVPYREDLLTYSPHYGCPYDFVHLRTFNRGSLKDALIQSGFRVRSIRLDGFFWGRPQMFWQTYGEAVVAWYTKIRAFFTSRGLDDSNVTLYNPLLLRLLMMPSVLVADAEKVQEAPRSKVKSLRQHATPDTVES